MIEVVCKLSVNWNDGMGQGAFLRVWLARAQCEQLTKSTVKFPALIRVLTSRAALHQRVAMIYLVSVLLIYCTLNVDNNEMAFC